MPGVTHRTADELESGLAAIRQAPRDHGVLKLIVRRPRTDEREVLQEAQIDLVEGLVGDKWTPRGGPASSHLDTQLTVMNFRVISLVAPEPERWPLAGDQLFIDLDLSGDNLPAGTKLALGSAVIVVTAQPHTGCQKFKARFGVNALQFVNSPVGLQLCLRGINARVLQPGTIRVGDVARKVGI